MVNYSESWAVRKDDKTPLVDQLVNNIRWSIFTGEIRWTEKLPPIRSLAQELGLGVNTVRNAYKKLEEQSLVVTKPHIGTVVQMEVADRQKIKSEIIATLKSAMYYGVSATEIRELVEKTLSEAEKDHKRRIIFTYADPIVGHRYSMQIAREVGVLVQEVPIDKLHDTVAAYEQIENLDAIVTTYFSYPTVCKECPDLKSIIFGMTVEVSNEVVGVLNGLPNGSKITLLCKKDESAEGFVNLITRDYPMLIIEVYHETNRKDWQSLTADSSAVFVSPSLMPEVINCEFKPVVYEIWNSLNAKSIQNLKDHLY